MYQFKLPDIGEGTHEAEIIQWRVKVGDTIREDDPLVEVQSDKATVDLPSPVDGVVTNRIGNEGDLAIVGSVILEIDTGGQVAALAPVVSDNTAVAPPTGAAPAPAPAPVASESSYPLVHPQDVDIRTLAPPRVRRYAREKGIDLRTVAGTGKSGLITMADVELAHLRPPVSTSPAVTHTAVAAAPAAALPAVTAPPAAPLAPPAAAGVVAAPAIASPVSAAPLALRQGERREAMSPIRKATARAMVHAKATVPHVTVFDRADVSALVAHRNRLKPLAQARGIKLTYTPYIIKAAVAMLRRHPHLNAYADMDAQEVVYRSSCNISVATNTDQGLFVPVVQEADRLSLFDIAREVDRLGEVAKAGQLTVDHMRGGSLTITNVGGIATGGVWSTPIINVPEPIIIGIGRIEGEFLPDEDKQPVLRDVLKISFGFDHRIIDGVAAQLGLNDLKAFLSDPDLLFAEA